MQTLVLLPLIILIFLVGLFSIAGLSKESSLTEMAVIGGIVVLQIQVVMSCGDLGVDTYCPDRQSTFP